MQGALLESELTLEQWTLTYTEFDFKSWLLTSHTEISA